MTDQPEIERLFTAIYDLTEHNTELQAQMSACSHANVEQN